MSSRSQPKKLTLTRVKDLSPALCSKEINVKAIVLECNAKDEANASNNATLLVGDDSGCVSLVLPKTAALHVRLGDILQLASTQLVLKSNRVYLWGGKVERVGEFLLLFKESANVSNITWVKDPKNPDVLIPGRNPAKRLKPQATK
ncbi:SOSS complex subunit B [Phytophthora cinnamomi]|uniref:SOSS complex subunit B n=1 Tax=Phytophthora cinnamomi TaxID=4785 RepID=UPI003559DD15|nr:SOSS complex subunit B [Phytophthora cinnamomi]